MVVSGLPRSGTSMLMKMLTAGGLQAMVDYVREADSDNPRGYFEFERVKDLTGETDKSWIREARGKCIKVISHLLRDLPDENFYLIIMAERDLGEVIASQNIMLRKRGEANSADDEKVVELYKKHLISAKILANVRPNMKMLEVRYSEALDDPRSCAERINKFLGGGLDIDKMKKAVEQQLYRNRTGQLRVSRDR